MALAELDGWGEEERRMAVTVCWLWNGIVKPERGKELKPNDVMIDWTAERKQETRPKVDRQGLSRLAGQ